MAIRMAILMEGAMHIVFTTEGGLAFFSGRRQPAELDSHDLSSAEAAELERLLASADFFELPEDCQTHHRGAADYQQYTVCVEQGARRHTVRLIDPVEQPQLQALLDFLRCHARHPLAHG
jgi:hypothetical protein